MLKGNKFDISNKIDRIIHESARIITFSNQTKIRLLHDGYDAHDEINRLRIFGRNMISFSIKLLGSKLLNFRCKPIDRNTIFFREGITNGHKLHNIDKMLHRNHDQCR